MAKFVKTRNGSKYAMYSAYNNWFFHQYPLIEIYRTKKSSKFYNPIVADGFRRHFNFKAISESSVAGVVVFSTSFVIPLYLMLFGFASTGLLQLALLTIAALFFLSYPLFALHSRIVLKSTVQATVNLKHLGFKHETSREDFVGYFNKNTAQAEAFINLVIEENTIAQKLDHAVEKTAASRSKSENSGTIDFVVKDIEKKAEVLESRLHNVQSEIKLLVAPVLEQIEAKITQDKEQELLLIASSM